jgi:hypothetical protein
MLTVSSSFQIYISFKEHLGSSPFFGGFTLLICFVFILLCSPEGEGGILFYLCPSFRPSKIFFVKKEYFFGFESGDLLVNLISIIAKNYIFKCKLNEQRLNIVEFSAFLYKMSGAIKYFRKTKW